MRAALVREYDADEILCRQGTTADTACLLKRGAVRSGVLTEKALDGADDARLRRGRDTNLFMDAGVMLGCEGALLGKYLNSLLAVEPVTVVEVPLDARGIIAMISGDSEFGLSLARALARRLVAANKSLGQGQRQASRFVRELQGLCTDYYTLVQSIQDDAEGEDDVLRALSVAKRTWTYYMGESGGAEVTKNTGRIVARIVRDEDMIGSQHRLKKGDLLCRRGDPGKSVYILVSGRLSVRIGDELYGIVRPGETVGEISVLLGDEEPRRVADIQAEEPSVVGMVPGDKFPALLASHTKLLINTCKLLCLRIRNCEQLAAESDDALKGVQSKFAGKKASFGRDIDALKAQLDLLIDEFDFPLHMEHEQLTRLSEHWSLKIGELDDRLAAAARG